MEASRAAELLSQFEKARVLVVGDLYLDEYVFGAVTGVSLEAPIPIYEVHRRRHNPGAAGNIACNAAALGARVWAAGVVGDDPNAEILRHGFEERGVDASGLVVRPGHPTNTYGKVVAGGYNIPEQEILRMDTPRPVPLDRAAEDALINVICGMAGQVDAIIVGDQAGAVATERVLGAITDCAREHGLLTVGDSRSRAGALRGFAVLVPNDREACVGVGVDPDSPGALDEAMKQLLAVAESALVTRGPLGIRVYGKDGSVADVPATVPPNEVLDVTGAGDTVTAAATVTLVAGGTMEEAAVIGNAAAGIAVRQKGVVTVPRTELEQALAGGGRPAKLRTLGELESVVRGLQEEGRRVVWTNGCFDILHVGHITYLQRAAAEGDILVVGINSDASVRSLKGPERPVVPEDERAALLCALACVGYVTIFGETDTVPILKRLKPLVYAKGGDYTIDTINQEERRVVEGYGGAIALVPGVEGRSTSNLIIRIKQ
jgi:D-beta-D-heptose 7-phosphate kinase / D-beta-D-heptose 1-phosphate adenosyltransferase